MSKALATKNVAAVLLGVAMVFGFAFSFAAPAKADTLSDLQAQVQALLAQIASLQGGSTSGGACFTFTQNLKQGATSAEVQQVQKFLNSKGFTVAATGAGSVGNETTYFGPATKAAVIKFQNAYSADILVPNGLSAGNGNWYASTRAKANSLCTSTGNNGNNGNTGTVGGNVVIGASSQPANSLAPMKATRVPFTTFTLTNTSNAAVTINGVTVQRTGLANNNAFAGVVLLDSTGLQYGNSQTFNSNDQATIGGTFTLNAGQSMTFTVAGNMETGVGGYAGQVASISVVGINTTGTVSGSLPITGASHTINESLTIGTADMTRSSFDPNNNRSVSLGTTGIIFGGVRITANNEDQKLMSISWNQTGSAGATDFSNLMTVVNGVSYPVTVDASGKYFTTVIPGGVLITKGNTADVYIKGDITGSNASGRRIEFDVYRASDVYLVGQTYGYGILPTSATGGSFTSSGNNTSSGFRSANQNPFYFGAYVDVTGGTLSTVSNASSIAPQNIAVNVSGQVLGGFTTNFTGEPVTVQSILIDVATTSGATKLQNVTLVDQNGLVVAGPVDSVNTGSGTATITFNSSVTFPVGSNTYTIKGTVSSGATEGATYGLSTDPSDWGSAVGQTSGTYVTLPSTTVTMSTMTVQPGKITISASASPAATTIMQNQSNYTIANIVLDATQSGEDLRLNALPIVVNAVSGVTATELKSNLTNCQLYNNGTVLNSQSVGTNEWTVDGSLIRANFIFTNSLTVAKGSNITLALQCNIGGSFDNGDQFNAGVSGSIADPTVTGTNSGNSIDPTVNTTASGTMTIGTASLAASVPTSISYTQATGGTTGVTVGTFTLQPTSGSVNLQKIALQMNSNVASSSDLVNGQVTIWQGSTQVGTVSFNGVTPSAGVYTATTTLASGYNLAQNVSTQFTIKADIAAIGVGQSGTSGHEIRVALANANGTSGNTSVNSGSLSMPSTGVAVFRSAPIVASSGASSGSLLNATGQLLNQFTITGNGGQGISLKQVGIFVGTSTASAANGTTSVSNLRLYVYDAGGNTVNTGNATQGQLNATGVTPVSGGVNKVSFDNVLQVPAGTTYTFKVFGDVSQVAGTNGAHGTVQTYLAGDGTDLAPVMLSASTVAGSYNMVWSPNSTTTPSNLGSADWTNGFGVSGLPSTGVSPATTLSN